MNKEVLTDDSERKRSTSTGCHVMGKQQNLVPLNEQYISKPKMANRFQPHPIDKIIERTLKTVLNGKTYDGEIAKTWTIKIANEVNRQVRELHLKRYKHIVQVTLGELEGAGVKLGVRCLWDAETDGFTSHNFLNESIFAVVVVFALYLY